MHWYEINNIETFDTPALVIYQERVLENIRLLKQMVNNKLDRLRPHVKTNKIAEVCQMMRDAGIYKFKCATIAEAEMLAMIGAEDVLLAYQPVGPKANRLLQLSIKFPSTTFSCVVDNLQSAQYLSSVFSEHELSINIYIDINTGMNRTGISIHQAIFLYEKLELLRSINVKGLHVYDGHIRETDIVIRKQKVAAAYSDVKMLVEKIEAANNKKMVIIAGGSTTFSVYAQLENIECSPGTFIFWDNGYKTLFPDQPFDCASLVITRVISIIDKQTITTDLGHKSVAAESPLPRIFFLNAVDSVPISHSEEHLVVTVPDSENYKVGDILYGIPFHICPTVALYNTALLIKKNTVVDEWKVIARDRKISI
jgi:D-serine deaminase-like pyridoxal phosphate-dependent protein